LKVPSLACLEPDESITCDCIVPMMAWEIVSFFSGDSVTFYKVDENGRAELVTPSRY